MSDKIQTDLIIKMQAEGQDKINELEQIIQKLEKVYSKADESAKKLKEEQKQLTQESQKNTAEIKAHTEEIKKESTIQEKAQQLINRRIEASKRLGNELNELNKKEKTLNQVRKEAQEGTLAYKKSEEALKKLREEIQNKARAYVESQRQISRLNKLLNLQNQTTRSVVQSTNKTTEALKRQATVSREAGQAIQKQADSTDKATNAMADFAKAMAGAMALKMVAKEAIEFDKAMTDIEKVTKASGTQLETLAEQIQKISVASGISAVEIAKMAEAGARLGVPIDQLGAFVNLAEKMSVAFYMSAEEAGVAAAKLANVFNLPILQVEDLADAINILGNNTVAREADIVEALTRMGGNAKMIGLTAKEASALADTFLSLGKTPQVAGTALNSFLMRLMTGGAGVTNFEAGLQKLGMTTDTLANKIKQDANGAVLEFLESLEKLQGEERADVLVDMFGAMWSDEIGLMVGSLDVYRKALGLVNDETLTAGSMTYEFQKKMTSASAQLSSAREAFRNLAIVLGTHFLPMISGVASGFTSTTEALRKFSAEHPMITSFITDVAGGLILLKAGSAGLSLAMRTLGMSAGASAVGLGTATTAMTATATVSAGAKVAVEALAFSLMRIGAFFKTMAIPLTGLYLAIEAFKSFNTDGSLAFNNIEEASNKSKTAIKAFHDELLKTGKVDTSKLNNALNETNNALAKSKTAVSELYKDLAKIGAEDNYIASFIDAAKDALPFWDSTLEKLEKAEKEVKDLAQSYEDLSAHQKKVTEEAVKAGTRMIELSEKAKKVNEALAKGELADNIKEINSELEAVNNSYKTLGLEVPKALQLMTQGDKDIIFALKNIREQTKLTTDEMREMLAGAMSKIDTEPAKAEIKKFYDIWIRQQREAMEEFKKNNGANLGLKELNEQINNSLNLDNFAKQVEEIFEMPIGKARDMAKQLSKEAEQASKEAEKASKKALQETEKALSAFGLSVEDASAGVSKGVSEMAGNWVTAMSALEQNGTLTAQSIQTAFNEALGNLKTAEDFKLFEQTLNETGTKAQLTAQQIEVLNAGLNGGSQAVSELNQKKNELNKTQEQSNQTIKQNIQVNNEAVQAQKELSQATEETTEAQKKQYSATIKLYDSAGLTAEQIAQLTKMNKEYTSAFNKYYGQTGMHDHLEVLGMSIKETSRAMAEMNNYLDELESKISDGSVSIEDLNYHIGSTSKGMIRLDNSTLSRLNATIDKAREKIKQLADDAKAVADDIEADLSRLNGDESLGMKLEQERKIKALEAKLKEAERQKNVDAVAQYQRAISLQQQYNTKETEQYQQRKQEEKQREIEQQRSKNEDNHNSDNSQKFAQGFVSDIRSEVEKARKNGEKAGKEALMKEIGDAWKRQY